MITSGEAVRSAVVAPGGVFTGFRLFRGGFCMYIRKAVFPDRFWFGETMEPIQFYECDSPYVPQPFYIY